MTSKLKSRTSEFPPGGWSFVDIKTGMKFNEGAFGDVVMAIIKHRQANPRVYPPEELESFDQATVANELDAFTCSRLNNNPRWCVSGEPTPVDISGLEFMIMPNKCPKCGCPQGYQILCRTCAGRRVTGYYCADCKTLVAK